MIGGFETHPAADLFPMMDEGAYAELVADMQEHGLRLPIVRWWSTQPDGTRRQQILDGRNRLRACSDARVTPRFQDVDDATVPDPYAYVISLNLSRRHLTEAQRAMIAARVYDVYAERAKGRKAEGNARGGKTDKSVANLPPTSEPRAKARDEAAAALNVGARSVDRARAVQATGDEALIGMVDAGQVAVSAAAEVAKLPPEQRQEVVQRGPSAVKAAARELREEREHKGAPLTDEMRDGMRALYRAAADAADGAAWGDDAVRQALADKYRVTRAEVDAVLGVASPEPAEKEPIAAHVVEGIRSMARGGWSVERIARNYHMGVDEVNEVLSGAPLVVEDCEGCGELETDCTCDAETPSSDVEEPEAADHPPLHARDLAHDQWWTPPELARVMVELAGVQPGDNVLEPSAGAGSIVEALLAAGATVEAHELDPRWARYLRICGRHDVSHDPRWTSGQVDLYEGDYLASASAPANAGEARAFSHAVMNPPYKGGLDGLFLGRVLDEADVVVALLRVNALCGQERYRTVWEKHAGRCSGIHPLVIRPDFTGSDRGSEGQGAKSDFVVLVFGAEDLGERAPLRHLVDRYGGGKA